MNASRKTVIIARGIALYAAFQDQPAIALTTEEKETAQAWEDWQLTWPLYSRFVCDEQFALFDKVNARF